MKRLFKMLVFLMICLAVSFPQYCHATSSESVETNIIKIGYTDDSGTFISPAISGYDGYGYDYMQEILLHIDGEYQVEFVLCEWEEVTTLLESGTIDLFGPCLEFGATDEECIYSSLSVGDAFMFIATQEHSTEYAEDYSHYDGCTIGIFEGDNNVGVLEDFIENTGVSLEIVYFSQYDYLETTDIETVDYFITYSFNHVSEFEIVTQIGSIPLYYMTSDDDQELIEVIDAALQKMAYEEYLYQEKLYIKYYDYDITANTYVSDADLVNLQSYGTYTAVVQNLYSPFSEMGENGELQGVAIDFINMLEDAAGIEIDVVEVDASTINEVEYDFSLLLQGYDEAGSVKGDVYLAVPILLLERNGEVKDHIVGTLSYYGIDEEYLIEYLDGQTIATYTNVQEMQEDFDAGKISAMLITTSSLNYIANDLEEKNYLTTPVEFDVNLTMTFPSDFSKNKISIFNRLIANLDQTQLSYSLLQNSSASSDELTVFEFYQKNPLMIIVIFIVFGFVIWIMSIRKSLEERRHNNYDELTLLYTERKFHDEVYKKIQDNPSREYLLISIDIDNFKYINELYGYDVGTEILKMFANHMKKSVSEETILARTFADNFFLLVAKVDYEKQILNHANNNSMVLQELNQYLGEEYRITFSVGIYEIHDKKLELNFMMDCTNLARLQGKGISDTTIDFYDEEINDRRIVNNDIITSMEQGIVGNEFVFYYQPKVDLNRGCLHGAEALVRWNKNGVFTPPNSFIPLFEKNGFIRVLDYYVFEAVCKFIAVHSFETIPQISINFSGVTIVETDVLSRLLAIIEKYDLKPEYFDIELTETAFVERFDAVKSTVHALHAEGFTVSMDDFGAGISSLNRLKNIDIDTIKIDRELLEGHMEDEKGIVILKGILDMSNGLGLDIVAEGVETREQMKFLQNHNCYIGQGYYFSKPVAEQEFYEMCNKNKFDIS
ncbi:MAG: EAL domain-containing protein [Lachnospiraceae bacterium]